MNERQLHRFNARKGIADYDKLATLWTSNVKLLFYVVPSALKILSLRTTIDLIKIPSML